MILATEPVLAAAGYDLVVIVIPADPVAARERVSELLNHGVSGIVCCPSVYSTMSAMVANSLSKNTSIDTARRPARPLALQNTGETMVLGDGGPPASAALGGFQQAAKVCPVIVLWQGAGKAMVGAIEARSGEVAVGPPQADVPVAHSPTGDLPPNNPATQQPLARPASIGHISDSLQTVAGAGNTPECKVAPPSSGGPAAIRDPERWRSTSSLLEGQRPRWPAYQQTSERPPRRSRLYPHGRRGPSTVRQAHRRHRSGQAVGPPGGSLPVFFLELAFKVGCSMLTVRRSFQLNRASLNN